MEGRLGCLARLSNMQGTWHSLSLIYDLIQCLLLQGNPEILHGTTINPYTMRYLPPFDEFEVDRCILPPHSTVAFPSAPGPSIFVVMGGEGRMTTSPEAIVAEGDVLFAPANTNITVATSSGLHLYRAGVNSRFFEE